MRICPICGNGYEGYPALSRRDNRTEICPKCGMIESIQVFLASLNDPQECTESSGNVFNGGNDHQ